MPDGIKIAYFHNFTRIRLLSAQISSMFMSMKRSLCIVCVAVALLLMSCDDVSKPEFPWGEEKTVTVPLQVTAGEKIYLIKYNLSEQAVPKQYTGNLRYEMPAGFSASMSQPEFSRLPDASPLVFTHHQAAMEFNAAPPLVIASQTQDPFTMLRTEISPPPFEENDIQLFWVQNAQNQWVQTNARLVKRGEFCYVWVSTGSLGSPPIPQFANYDDSSSTFTDNKIKDTQAEALAEKFDQIYPLETDLFGFEYGGGQAGNGGIDQDSRIHILVYDIMADSGQGGTVGFFWGKDEYHDGTPALKGLRSNEKEIFYIDSYWLDRRSEVAYTTLVHEFQHMIHFNKKNRGLNKATATWYNEMLSMLAEDMISSHADIDIDPTASPTQLRMPYFNRWYYEGGVTEWKDVYSYSQVYAFGAYLARNYGGAKLIYEMARNNRIDIDSVDTALKTLTGGTVGFNKALEKFPETLLNMKISPSNYNAQGVLQGSHAATFNNTVQGSLWSSPDLTNYDFTAFNLLTIPASNTQPPIYGPCIATVEQYPVSGHGIDVQYSSTANTSGTISLQLTYFTKSPVRMYFLGKKTDGTVVRRSAVYP
jgi:hypothetical protein